METMSHSYQKYARLEIEARLHWLDFEQKRLDAVIVAPSKVPADLTTVVDHFLKSIILKPTQAQWESSLTMLLLCTTNKAYWAMWTSFKADMPDKAALVERYALRTSIVDKARKQNAIEAQTRAMSSCKDVAKISTFLTSIYGDEWVYGSEPRGMYLCKALEYRRIEVIETLRENNLLTPECGKEWYERHLPSYRLYDALKQARLLSADLGRQWFADHAPKESLPKVLRRFGLLTAECGVPGERECSTTCAPGCKAMWYVEHCLDRHIVRVLRETGLLSTDLGLPWICNNIPKRDIIGVMVELHVPFPDEREWYIDNLNIQDAYDVMDHLGLVTAEGGADWYRDHVQNKELMIACLRAAGLLTSDLGRDWFAEAFKYSGYKEILKNVLKELGLLTADCGADWYAEVFKRQPYLLADVLREAGLLTADLGLDWYKSSAFAFDGRLLIKVLRETGLLTADLGRDWFAATLHWSELVEVLEETGLLTADCGADWYAKHFDGKQLAEVLAKAGLDSEGYDCDSSSYTDSDSDNDNRVLQRAYNGDRD